MLIKTARRAIYFSGNVMNLSGRAFGRSLVAVGVGATIKIEGSTANLEQFAKANGCSLETSADLRESAKFSHVPIVSLPRGRYATFSCRERDIRQAAGCQARGH